MLCLLKTPIDSAAVSQQALLLCLYSLFQPSVTPLKWGEGNGEGTVIAELGSLRQVEESRGEIEGSRESLGELMITNGHMDVFSSFVSPMH